MAEIKRRDFLKAGTLATLASISPAALARLSKGATIAKSDGEMLRLFDDSEARVLEAIAERIIPATDTPGAKDLGVVHFIDRACDEEMATALPFIRQSIADINMLVGVSHDGIENFAALDDDAQDAFLKTQELTPFFQLMLFLTRAGYYGMAKYGGNADHRSWELVGYRGHHGGWQYPFGHYDAEVHGGKVND